MAAKAIAGLIASITILAGCGDNIQPGTPKVSVTPVAGLRTTEAGGQATFTVALEDRPSQDVLIELSSSDTGEGTVSPTTLTFTRDNFNAPRTITITGVQDEVADGAQSYTIVLAPAVSMDARFDGLHGEDVRVENIDDDSAGVTVTPLGGLTTTEAGGTAAFTVVLDSKPTASVAIALASSDVGEGTVSPASLTFTADNWNAPQTVTVTGVDDLLSDGTRSYRIVTAAATSGDPGYAGLDADDVTVSNTDNDTAGIAVTPVTSVTTEAGGQATFTVVLSSQPTADVTIPIASMDPSEGTTDVTRLTFTTTSWNAPQAVTVTGVDDAVADGNQAYVIATGPATSSDPGYAGLDAGDVSLTNTDNDSAGVTLSKVSGLATTESGGADTFTVVLNSQPTADVTIALSSSDTGEGTASPAILTFTPVNWDAPQTVTVTGTDDPVSDGNQPYRILTAPAVSADPGYGGLDAADASATNIDNDSAGFIVTPTSGLRTTEGGGQATFTIVLTSQPTADVTIPVASSDPNEGAVSPPDLTFTPANWNAPQTVTITGVDDFIADGGQPYTIVIGAAISGDAGYSGVNPSDVAVTNADNDSAGITVSKASIATTEGGGQDTFTIVLSSQPTASVTIALSSSDTAEGTVSPASVTFTTFNWNAPQTITATGINDFVADGNQTYSIITAPAASADAAYQGCNAADVAATNLDNDSPGIITTPTAGLQTAENGGAAAFAIVLASQPTSPVTIGLASTDATEGAVSPASVTFTPLNWNAPQSVTITGVDDAVADGNQVYEITTAAAASADPAYNGLDAADVSVTNIDNDSPGIRVTPTSGLSTTEAGGTATFDVVLESQPAANVTIPLSSSDLGEGTVTPASLTFTPANWNAPQSVTVTGVDDLVADGNQPYTIVLAPAASADPGYNLLDPADVAVANVDNDTAGVVVNPTGGLTTTEAGGSAFFTVALTSQPLASVTITLASSDPSEGTLPITTITFTPTDWNLPQTVSVDGVNDTISDGNQPYTVVTSATSSADPAFDNLPVADVAVTNMDDDIPGFTVDPVGGLSTSEFGDFDTFTIVLNTMPTASVTIGLSINDTTEATLGGVTSVTFTPLSWNVPQTVTVTGVNDALADGTQPFLVVTAPAVSADPSYNGLNPPDIDGTNFDNDTPGVYVKGRRLLRTSESGGKTFFRVSLTTQPTSNVTCTFSSSDPTEGTVSPTILTFTPTNYATLQNVNVQGVDDTIVDGDQLYTVISAPCTSADGSYNLMNPRDVSVLNRDND
jgi:hypothetical protein